MARNDGEKGLLRWPAKVLRREDPTQHRLSIALPHQIILISNVDETVIVTTNDDPFSGFDMGE